MFACYFCWLITLLVVCVLETFVYLRFAYTDVYLVCLMPRCFRLSFGICLRLVCLLLIWVLCVDAYFDLMLTELLTDTCVLVLRCLVGFG